MASTVKLELPAALGVPEIVPELLRVNPAGKLPEATLHLIVPTPPLDWRLALYAALTTPLGRELVVITSMALMVMLSDWFAVWGGVPESVAVTVNLLAPAAVGVPEMTPELLKLSPPGKLPEVTLQLMEPVPPVAATDAL